jgi:hypothetical protein
MINTLDKEKARAFRKQGKTYREISDNLGRNIPKSTLSCWCKDIVLSPEHQGRISKINIQNLATSRQKAIAVNARKRQEFLLQIEERNKNITDSLNEDSLKIVLASLYLGEGAKWKSHRGLSLGSSDPEIIRLYIRLLRLCYDVSLDRLRCRVSHRADQDIDKLQKFWSSITEIPINHFYKTIPDPRTVGKRTKKKDYMGVCVVSGGGAEIQLELQIISNIVTRACSSAGRAHRWHR